MEDREIIELFMRRDESALEETGRKYERYLTKIAYNILADEQDCEESLNDAYLKLWNSIPPQNPENLPAFMSGIVRRTSIDIFRKKHSAKRIASEYALSLDEISDLTDADGASPYTALELSETASAINAYLGTLKKEQRDIFVMRYYFFDSVKSIAASLGISEAKVKTALHRMRAGLKAYLEKEEII